jgi:hypothetical protein
MLFATEVFESYNAIIRSKSIHSNRLAPSRDIALAFAKQNRIRHMLSSGIFLDRSQIVLDKEVVEKFNNSELPQADRISEVQWYFRSRLFAREHWTAAGKSPLDIVMYSDAVGGYLGLAQRPSPPSKLYCIWLDTVLNPFI